MIRPKVFIYIGIFLLGFIACQNKNNKKTSEAKDIISVSIPPQSYFVRQLAGDRFQINVMIPPGANPVTYDPPPGKMKKVAQSEAYIKIGHLAFEKIWMDKFRSMNAELAIYDQSGPVDLIHIHEKNHAHDHAHHAGVDPHIWTSPAAVKKQIVVLKEALIELDPQNKRLYQKNYRNFISKIDSLDQFVKETVEGSKNHSFMIFHPALSYFSRDYHLEQIPIEFEGKEPSPSRLKKLIDLAREKQIDKVLIQKQFNTDNAEMIAKEIGAEVVVINPLDSNWVEAIQHITFELVGENSHKK